MADRISIFLRLRPCKGKTFTYRLDDDHQRIDMEVPKKEEDGLINNTREHYGFAFNKTFPTETSQDAVFDAVARPSLEAALDGYNGTIFAYGQTGSGKTFTITGGAERYADRGIIPRSLSMLFQEFKKRRDFNYQMYVSYLEIYQDNGYDLLSPKHESMNSLEDLPRVHLQEDDDGNIHLGNLSAQTCNSEEDALNALFLGDMNRMISETPMNPASSRSHCIFTIYLTATKPGSDVVRKSKVHLVDLAGSERVHKTQYVDDGKRGVVQRGQQASGGQLLREAKGINLSLHFLEMCIKALQDKAKGKDVQYIPYRNSILTSVLRDSLGGNCKTSMIATISPEERHMEESKSTCQFAQRVACVANSARANEEVDPRLVMKRLKKEVAELKEEIALLKGGVDNGPITDEGMRILREKVAAFVADKSEDADLMVGADMVKIRMCFRLLKDMIKDGGGGGGGASTEQVKKLQLQIAQRDNEINILVNMLKKGGNSGAPDMTVVRAQAAASASDPSSPATAAAHSSTPSDESRWASRGATGGSRGAKATSAAADAASKASAISNASLDAELLKDRNKAFEAFRKSYRKNEVIEENKQILKGKYAEAQNLGESVKRSRDMINRLKKHIEQLRTERAMQGLVNDEGEVEADPEEESFKQKIDEEKAMYKASYEKLKGLKPEIEHLQLMLEKSRVQLQRDFEQWLALMAQAQCQRPSDGGSSALNRTAPARAGGMTTPVASPEKPSTASSSASTQEARAASSVVLTGNKDADADIMAFYKAREQVLKR